MLSFVSGYLPKVPFIGDIGGPQSTIERDGGERIVTFGYISQAEIDSVL